MILPQSHRREVRRRMSSVELTALRPSVQSHTDSALDEVFAHHVAEQCTQSAGAQRHSATQECRNRTSSRQDSENTPGELKCDRGITFCLCQSEDLPRNRFMKRRRLFGDSAEPVTRRKRQRSSGVHASCAPLANDGGAEHESNEQRGSDRHGQSLGGPMTKRPYNEHGQHNEREVKQIAVTTDRSPYKGRAATLSGDHVDCASRDVLSWHTGSQVMNGTSEGSTRWLRGRRE